MVIPSGPSRNFVPKGYIDMHPIPQLYGGPDESHEEYSIHRGSCLSASFEMVMAGMRHSPRRWNKTSSLPVISRGLWETNQSDTTYSWNQATIHHWVWASTKRLADLAHGPLFEDSNVPDYVAISAAPTSSTRQSSANSINLKIPTIQEFILFVKGMNSLGLPIIICVKPTEWNRERSMTPWEFPSDECMDWFVHNGYILKGNLNHPPLKRPSSESVDGFFPESGREVSHRVGHAMVISGLVFRNESLAYCRILDPSPSLDLRASVEAIHSPNQDDNKRHRHVKYCSIQNLFELYNELMVFIPGRKFRHYLQAIHSSGGAALGSAPNPGEQFGRNLDEPASIDWLFEFLDIHHGTYQTYGDFIIPP